MNLTAMMVGISEKTGGQLSMMLENSEIHLIGTIKEYDRVLELIEREKPEFLFLDAKYERKLFMLCQQIYLLYPKCIMVMLADNADVEVYQYAIEAGVRKVFSPVPHTEELVAALKEIYISEDSRYANLSGDGINSVRSEVITVFGAKGGIGKTMTAVNLAVRLAMSKKKVVLLDFNLQFGDTSLYLGMEPKETIAELLLEQRSPTLDVIRNHLMYHPSRLQVLFGPKSPEYAENITGSSIEKIINILKNYYDYIVIDCAVGFSDINLVMLDLSTKIFLMVEEDICTLRNTKQAALLFSSLNFEHKVKMILNRKGSGGIASAEIERILGFKMAGVLSQDDKNSISALNQGKPLVMLFPKCNLAQELNQLLRLLNNTEELFALNGGRKKTAARKKKGRS